MKRIAEGITGGLADEDRINSIMSALQERNLGVYGTAE
jgi:hypothetical protein